MQFLDCGKHKPVKQEGFIKTNEFGNKAENYIKTLGKPWLTKTQFTDTSHHDYLYILQNK